MEEHARGDAWYVSLGETLEEGTQHYAVRGTWGSLQVSVSLAGSGPSSRCASSQTKSVGTVTSP